LSQLCVAFRSETVSFLNKRTGVRVRLTKSWCSRNADRLGHQLVQRLGTTVAKPVKQVVVHVNLAANPLVGETRSRWGPKDSRDRSPRSSRRSDSFDELIETNELNNVATFTRGEIAVIETTVEAPAAAGAAPAVAPAEAPASRVRPRPRPPVLLRRTPATSSIWKRRWRERALEPVAAA
jgi:hypothetical protein